MKLTEILKAVPKATFKLVKKPWVWIAAYIVGSSLASTAEAGEVNPWEFGKDKNFWDRVENSPIDEKKINDNKFNAYLRMFGIASDNGPDYFSGEGKVVAELDKNLRLGSKAATTYSSDRGIEGLRNNLEVYLGNYFRDKATVYAQVGVDLSLSNSNGKNFSLDETLVKGKAKIGVDNEDFRGDVSFAVGFGHYDGSFSGTKKDDGMFSLELKGNAKVKTGTDVDIEAGFELAYKQLDGLWNQFAANLGAGLVWKVDDNIAMKLSGYYKHLTTDSGISRYIDAYGVQYELFGRIFQNKDIKVTLVGAIRYEDREGFGAFASIGVSTK